jgi:hypothetical protein
MSIAGIIKNAIIIIILDLDDGNNEKAHFLYGTVVSDSLQRFNAEDWFLSSKIINIVEDKVETRNSIYLLQDEPEFVELTINEFLFVQQGHEPDIAKKFAAMQEEKESF